MINGSHCSTARTFPPESRTLSQTTPYKTFCPLGPSGSPFAKTHAFTEQRTARKCADLRGSLVSQPAPDFESRVDQLLAQVAGREHVNLDDLARTLPEFAALPEVDQKTKKLFDDVVARLASQQSQWPSSAAWRA